MSTLKTGAWTLLLLGSQAALCCNLNPTPEDPGFDEQEGLQPPTMGAGVDDSPLNGGAPAIDEGDGFSEESPGSSVVDPAPGNLGPDAPAETPVPAPSVGQPDVPGAAPSPLDPGDVPEPTMPPGMLPEPPDELPAGGPPRPHGDGGLAADGGAVGVLEFTDGHSSASDASAPDAGAAVHQGDAP